MHAVLCYPAATSRGYPPLHAFWESVAPYVSYLIIGIFSAFDDRVRWRYILLVTFSACASFINGLVWANLTVGRPRPGHFVGMLGLAFDRPIAVCFSTLVCFLAFGSAAVIIDEVSVRVWRRIRMFSGPGEPFLQFNLVAMLILVLAIGSLALLVAGIPAPYE